MMRPTNLVLGLFCLFIAPLALSTAACGDKKTETPSGDTTVIQQDAAGEDVLTSDSTEPVGTRCASTTECTGAGEVCSCEGICVVATGNPCTEDRNCGVPRWCNTCTGHCEEQAELCESCTASRGCRDQGACLPYSSGGNFCGLACQTDAGCGRGYRCVEVDGVATKQCVARSGICESLDLCTADTECPVGKVCNTQTGQCLAGCEDGGCPEGDVCTAGRCVAGCTGNADCVAPGECQDSGKCKIPGTCEERADCPDAETYCDRTTGLCAAGCAETIDCQDAGKICEGRACVRKGCEFNYQCAFGEVCSQATGDCVPYPASEPYCAVCDPQAESDPACPAPNLCVTFQDDEGQALGDHCLVPCKADPDNACPSGWQCQRLDDPNGGDPQFMCSRPCYISPVGTP